MLHLSLLNGLMPTNLLYNASATFLPPAWSITLEWQYYLFAPIIAAFALTGARLFVLICIAGLGLHFGHLWINPLPAFFPAQLPLFLIGIGSYHLYAQSFKPSALTTKALPIFVVSLIAAGNLSRWHWLAMTIWALSFGSVLAYKDDFVSKMLMRIRALALNRFTQYLGRISYPLYLVHWPIIIFSLYLILYIQPDISQGKALLLLLGITLPVVLAVASWLQVNVEKPMMRYGKRISGKYLASGALLMPPLG